jgi:addiction module HigA family antidote
VNDQFRLCFRWTPEGPAGVEFTDYHWREGRQMTETLLPPVHPGEVLRDEFLTPLGLSAGAVARATRVPRTRIERLVNEQVDLTPDTALRLARFFGTSARFWLELQVQHDLEVEQAKLGDRLDHEVKPWPQRPPDGGFRPRPSRARA